MVPILNSIGTDVACVGVCKSLVYLHLCILRWVELMTNV